MTIDVKLKDGKGNAFSANVTKEHALLTSNIAIPSSSPDSLVRPFRQYITNDGLPTGSNDMRVDGSVNEVDFFITAPIDADRYIDTISITIADASAALNEFGNIGALTNGVEILYEDAELGNVTIGDGLISNFEFIRLCGVGSSPVGSGSTSYRANNVQGNSEGYIMSLDFSEVFGIPWGIRLLKNTTLKLIVKIKDNTLGVDKFDMIAYGFDRIIKD